MNASDLLVSALLLLSWLLMTLGIIGLFKFKSVYAKILNSSKIDSVAVIVVLSALIVNSGLSTLSVKLVAILVFYLLTNPVTNQLIINSAYKNQVPHEGED